ncbi:MAG: hypothetical protein B7Z55_14590 [Planctomycetales bacterium 12-60-4]|nr:MAG: hypothetical protein B7Z55_14590 [Planctomycetales bacterium 12-60-4]
MHSHMTRRGFVSSSLAGASVVGWLGRLATAAESTPPKSCILLWMAGGPSHLDTFDLKPEAPASVRGEFRPIETSVPGIEISEHFPRFAGLAIVSLELGRQDFPLPGFVCIGPGPRLATRSGFLGPHHQPLDVADPERGTNNLEPLVSREEFDGRYALLERFNASFLKSYQVPSAQAHASAVERAVRLMNADQKRAFELSQEPDAIRDRYGRGSFGQGCLMARRLVETGVSFVEVMMGDGVGWDTHRDNFPRTRNLSQEVDAGMSALIEDLHERGHLDSTLVIWMGEFGRSPQITSGAGRNHWARAWTSVLVGGGLRGGQVIGRTDRDAAAVLDRPIRVNDFLATVCQLLGIDYTQENRPTGVNRPIPIVDTSKPIATIDELL